MNRFRGLKRIKIVKTAKSKPPVQRFDIQKSSHREVIRNNKDFMFILEPFTAGQIFKYTQIPQSYEKGELLPQEEQIYNQVEISVGRFNNLLSESGSLQEFIEKLLKAEDAKVFAKKIEEIDSEFRKAGEQLCEGLENETVSEFTFLSSIENYINSYSNSIVNLVVSTLAKGAQHELLELKVLTDELAHRDINPFERLSFCGGGGSGMVTSEAFQILISSGVLTSTLATRGASVGAMQALATAFNCNDSVGYLKLADTTTMTNKINNNSTANASVYEQYCSTDYSTYHQSSNILGAIWKHVPYLPAQLHGFEMLAHIDHTLSELIQGRRVALMHKLSELESGDVNTAEKEFVRKLIEKVESTTSFSSPVIFTFKDLSYFHKAMPEMFAECEMTLCYMDSTGKMSEFMLNAKNSPELPLSVGARASAGFPKMFRALFINKVYLEGVDVPSDVQYVETLDGGALNNEPYWDTGLNQLMFMFAKQVESHESIAEALRKDEAYSRLYASSHSSGLLRPGDEIPLTPLQMKEVSTAVINLLINTPLDPLASVGLNNRYRREINQTIVIPHERFGVLAGLIGYFTPTDQELEITEPYVAYQIIRQVNQSLKTMQENSE